MSIETLDSAPSSGSLYLKAALRDRISSFKIPRHVRFVESWPMSATKIQKFKLREELIAELGL